LKNTHRYLAELASYFADEQGGKLAINNKMANFGSKPNSI
jgi:hypothetical protein